MSEIPGREDAPPGAENPVKSVISAFQSRGCQCGGKKKPKTYFCGDCYFQLPNAVQSKLYSKNFKTQVAGYQLGLEHFRAPAGIGA